MVVAVDLSTEHRWPRWGPAATALGIRAVVALRLFTDHTVGSISLYARHPGVDSGALEDAQIVAALASVVLAQVCTERDLRRAVALPGSDRAGTGHADATLRVDRGVRVRGATPLLPAAQHETGRAGRTAHHDGGAARPHLGRTRATSGARTRQDPHPNPIRSVKTQMPDAKCVPQQQVSPSRGDTGMTFTADDPVESGRSYQVTEVDGHRPEALSDFAGDTRLTLVKGRHESPADRGRRPRPATGCGSTRRIPGPTTGMCGSGSSPMAVTERSSPSRSPPSDDHPGRAPAVADGVSRLDRDEQMGDAGRLLMEGNGHAMDQDHIRDAAAAAMSARQAIDAASRRRASAVTAAQDLIDNARAAERAEQDAARSALAASIRRLLAENLSVGEIAGMCRMSTTTIRVAAAAT